MILLDTNILVYAVDAAAPIHASCRDVVERAMAGKLEAALVPQVLMEFYAVVTSPRRVRSPRSPSDAIAQVSDWRRSIPIRQPTPASLDAWTELAGQLPRVGQAVFDIYLVAQMRAHGIREICTANVGDFAGVPEVTARHPDTV